MLRCAAEVRGVATDQVAAGIPEGADGGEALRSVRRVWSSQRRRFVAFSLANADAEHRSASGQQVQCGCGLGGDCRVTAPGVGYPDAELGAARRLRAAR